MLHTYPPHIHATLPSAPADAGGGGDATPKEPLAYAMISAWRCSGRWLPFSIIAVRCWRPLVRYCVRAWVDNRGMQPQQPMLNTTPTPLSPFSLILADRQTETPLCIHTHTRTITTPAAHNATQTYERTPLDAHTHARTAKDDCSLMFRSSGYAGHRKTECACVCVCSYAGGERERELAEENTIGVCGC